MSTNPAAPEEQQGQVDPYAAATGQATAADVQPVAPPTEAAAGQVRPSDLLPPDLDVSRIAEGVAGIPSFYTAKDYGAGVQPTPEQVQNAHRYREARKIALATGLPIEWVAEHLDEARAAWLRGDDQVRLLGARHPELARWAIRNMDLVSDDISGLHGLAWLGKATLREWRDGQLQLELGKIRAKQALGLGTPADEIRLSRVKAELARRERDPYYGGTGFLARGWLDFVNMAPMTWDAMWHSVAGAGVGYATGYMVGAAGALIAGQLGPQAATPEEVVTVPAAAEATALAFSKWGARLGGFYSAATIEGGLAYDELLELGADDYTARGLAGVVGAINGGLEMLELEGLFRIIRGGRFFSEPASRAARREVLAALAEGKPLNLTEAGTRKVLREILRDQRLVGRLKTVFKRYAEAAVSETVTEVLQEATNIIADHVATYLSEDAQAASWASELQRLAEIATVTLRSMLVGGAIYPVPGFVIDTAHAIENQGKVQNLERVISLFEALDSGKDDPRILEEIAKVLKEDLPEDTVYVDREAWDAYWQEQGEDPEAKAREITGQENAYEQAQATGDVAIPIEKYVGNFANTKHHVGLMEHVRLHPGSVTMAEARAISEDEERRQAEQAEADAERAELTDRQKLELQIADQLVAAGLTSSAAHVNARIMGAFFEAFASRMNVPILELWTAGGKAPQGRVRIVAHLPATGRDGRPILLTEEQRTAEAVREALRRELTALENKRLEGKLLTDEEEQRRLALREKLGLDGQQPEPSAQGIAAQQAPETEQQAEEAPPEQEAAPAAEEEKPEPEGPDDETFFQETASRESFEDRYLDDLGFYSRLLETAKQMKFRRLPMADALKQLRAKKGVKKREWIEFGMEEMLQEAEARAAKGDKWRVSPGEFVMEIASRRPKLTEHHAFVGGTQSPEAVGPESIMNVADEWESIPSLLDPEYWYAPGSGLDLPFTIDQLRFTLVSIAKEHAGRAAEDFWRRYCRSTVAARIRDEVLREREYLTNDNLLPDGEDDVALQEAMESALEVFLETIREGYDSLSDDEAAAWALSLAQPDFTGVMDSVSEVVDEVIFRAGEKPLRAEDIAQILSDFFRMDLVFSRDIETPDVTYRRDMDDVPLQVREELQRALVNDDDGLAALQMLTFARAKSTEEMQAPEGLPPNTLPTTRFRAYVSLAKHDPTVVGYGELIYTNEDIKVAGVRRDTQSHHWEELFEHIGMALDQTEAGIPTVNFHTRYMLRRAEDGLHMIVEEVQSDIWSDVRKELEDRADYQEKHKLTDKEMDEKFGPIAIEGLLFGKNGWAVVALRRAFMLAVKAGATKFYWMRGAQVAELWSGQLRGEVKSIEWSRPMLPVRTDTPTSKEFAGVPMRKIIGHRPGGGTIEFFVLDLGKYDLEEIKERTGMSDPEIKRLYVGDPRAYGPLLDKRKAQSVLGGKIFSQIDSSETNGELSGEDLAFGAGGYEIVYDKAAVKGMADYLKTLDPSVKIEKAEIPKNAMDPESPTVKVWKVEITNKIREEIEGGAPYYQDDKKKVPRGYMRRSGPATFDIGILKDANLSTFIHEFAHFAFEFMGDLVEGGQATEDIRRDYERLLAFAGVRSRAEMRAKIQALKERLEKGEITKEEFNRLHPHERVARAFEVYMSEGKAPSQEMRGIFSRIRTWMIAVYRHAMKVLGIEINDEIRGVFDRWLATEEAIRQAKEEGDLAWLAKFAALAGGMSKEEAERYRRLVEDAEEEAKQEVARELMAELKAEQKKREAKIREEVRKQVEAEFYQDRTWRAIYYLQQGKMPPGFEGEEPPERLILSKDAIVDSYGQEMLAKLPRPAIYRREGGVHPDEVAPLFGFASGHEMLTAIAEKKQPRGRALRELVDQRVKERLGKEKLSTPEDLARAAEKALNGDALGRVFLAQLRRLASLTGRRLTPRRVLRENAERIVAGMRVADLHPHRFLQAREKATRELQAAMAVQDWERAWEAAERQARLHEMYRAARNAQQEAQRVRQRVTRLLSKKGLQRLGRAGAEYVDQFLALVERFDFVKLPAKLVQKRMSLREFILREREAGRDLVVPEKLQEEAFRRHWTELTLDELRGLDDAVRSLENQARLKRRLKLWKQELDEDEAAEILIEELKANLKDAGERPFDPNTMAAMERSLEQLKRLNASQLKPEQILDFFDGKQEGPWHMLLFQTIAQAQRDEDDLMAEFAQRLMALAAMLPEDAKKRLDQHVYIESLGQNVTIRTIIGIALNTGNESNLRKMMLGGYIDLDGERRPITAEMLNEMLGHLTEQEWWFVQSLWDMLEELWPRIEALERRLTGIAPKKVQVAPPPFQLPNMPNGLRGGYWPVAYDPDSGARSTQLDEIKNIAQMFEFGYARAATPHGHTIERIENYARPLTFNWEWILSRHLSQVIHDLTHREAVINVMRILMREDVAGAIRRYAGNAYYKALKAWVYAVANEQVFAEDDNARWWFNFTNKLRSNVAVAVMGFKVTTMLSQFAGFSASLEMVPLPYMARAVKQLVRDFSAMTEFMMQNSTEMKHRASNLERDIRDMIKAGQLNPGKVAKGVRKAAMAGIAYADLMVTVPTWHAAYMQEMDRTGDHDKAVAYADKVVRLTQGAGGIKDLSPVQRSRYLKLVTMFFSYFAALYGRLESWATDMPDIARRRAWNELPRWLMRGMYLVVIPAILSEILSGRVPDKDDDDSWAEWAAVKVVTYPMQTVPLLRDLTSTAEALLKGKRPRFEYRYTPLEDLGEKLGRAATSTARAIWGEEEWGKAIARDLEALGIATGMPTAQVKGTLRQLNKYWRGEKDDAGWGQFVYELLYGREMPEVAPLVATEED